VEVEDLAIRTRTITVEGDGVEIPVRMLWSGTPASDPIVLLHSKRGVNQDTIALAERLVEDGRTVILPDLLSRVGGSERTDRDAIPNARGVPREWLVDDLRAVVDAFGDLVERYTTVGFSHGGTLVWRLADHDPRCHALVDVRGRPPEPDAVDVAGVSCLVILLAGDDSDKRAAAERILATARDGHLEMVTLDDGILGEDRRSLADQESVWALITDWLHRHV
jgi:carboxymethylenebutenolidase